MSWANEFKTKKVACFGASSTGKTLQIRRLIETCGAANVAIVSCEDGLSTIESAVAHEHVQACNNIRDLREAFRWASDQYAGADKWVCVDGGTRALQWIAGEIWAGADAAYIAMATGTPRNELPVPLKPYLRFITSNGEIDGQRQWIQIGRDIEFELNRWAKLPANMYWTFWEELTSKGQYEKNFPWQADAPGKAGRDAVYGTFDFILRLTHDGERVVATHDPTKRVVRSKARDDWMGGIKVPAEQVDFNLAEFVQLITPHKPATEVQK